MGDVLKKDVDILVLLISLVSAIVGAMLLFGVAITLLAFGLAGIGAAIWLVSDVDR